MLTGEPILIFRPDPVTPARTAQYREDALAFKKAAGELGVIAENASPVSSAQARRD